MATPDTLRGLYVLGTELDFVEDKLGAPAGVKAIWKPNLSTLVDDEKAETIMKMIAALEDDEGR